MEITIVLRTRYASSHLERVLGFRDMTYGALEKGFAGMMQVYRWIEGLGLGLGGLKHGRNNRIP